MQPSVLQQHLPFTVLKLIFWVYELWYSFEVATALTVYGIETCCCLSNIIVNICMLQQHLPFTVLKLYFDDIVTSETIGTVATALTVYGIETLLTVIVLQCSDVATALTVYGIETHLRCQDYVIFNSASCNSTYRLRY